MADAPTKHPDLEVEQAYIDHAYACLDRMRILLERAPDQVEGEFAQVALEAWARGRLRTYLDAERGLCFGRLDLDGGTHPLYVGRRWVHDDRQDVVVVNWQAPAAQPYYTATPVDPQRVARRRRFRLDGRTLQDIFDEVLGGTEGDEPAPLADVLLDELQRSREPRMRDIVATIQADQYRLITRDLEGILVIQGGPGTGKTAVALHRASWLLYTFREQLAEDRVLVVGPNPTFMEYVSHVLPALGEEAVEQRAVGELVDGLVPGRPDEPDVERLKGDERMALVVERAIAARRRPVDEHLWVRVGGVGLTISPRVVDELVAEALDEGGSYAAGRERFRMRLLRRFYELYGQKLGPGAVLAFDDLERALRTDGFLRRVLDRVWPALDPVEVVRRLLTSPGALAAAAEEILDRQEQRLLLTGRPGRGQAYVATQADVALVDEAASLLEGGSGSYGHVIVDEAQDLTPMQLRMVARRARRGSMTILGDIAQATGPIDYERWEDVLPHLPQTAVAVEELRLAYRVPREIMELALPLLPFIAPAAEPPVAYRSGDEGPAVHEVAAGSLATSAAEQAALLRGREGTVGLIVPSPLVDDARSALEGFGLRWDESVLEELDPSVQLLTPRAAKGLEFDHVVVAEPAAIVEERGGVLGLRELYVALTRPTKTLVVVHSRPLPGELAG